jgi:hypothetical protein
MTAWDYDYWQRCSPKSSQGRVLRIVKVENEDEGYGGMPDMVYGGKYIID